MDAVTLARFEAKYIMCPMSGCWLWHGSWNNKGRGQMSIGGWPTLAHRLSYEHYIGPIPEGMLVCHRCDVGCCVNPAHLFTGTQLDNMRDCRAKGRHAHGATNGRRTKPECTLRGSRHGMARLTERDVLNIRARYEARDRSKGRGIKAAMAREHRVSQTMIGHIISRKLWRHI